MNVNDEFRLRRFTANRKLHERFQTTATKKNLTKW